MTKIHSLITFIVLVAIFSCSTVKNKAATVTDIVITELLVDSTLNVRALEIFNGNVLIATAAGTVWQLAEGTDKFTLLHDHNTAEHKPNFRGVATNGVAVFALAIGSPALLYKDDKLVYVEEHEKAFYDAIQFWNDQEGIAIGDPTDDCMSIIITRDGGETWQKVSCDQLPKAIKGEAAFAASNSNISIKRDQVWVATGGVASRVLHSADKGKSWSVTDTPVKQGIGTTGMYSIDFYDELQGFAIGGDYTKPADNTANKIQTKDGGKTWQLIASGSEPGYRSCVRYIPGGAGKELLAVGFEGIDYSKDSGNTWQHLSDEGYYTVRFVDRNTAYLAGNGRVSRVVLKRR